MICLSSAGGPTSSQMLWKFECLSTGMRHALTPRSMSSHLRMWLLHRVRRPWGFRCREQSAFVFRNRRASIALRFRWGEKHTLKEAYLKENPQWWFLDITDRFGLHHNSLEVLQMRLNYKCIVLKEEGDSSNVNQAYDRFVAKAEACYWLIVLLMWVEIQN